MLLADEVATHQPVLSAQSVPAAHGAHRPHLQDGGEQLPLHAALRGRPPGRTVSATSPGQFIMLSVPGTGEAPISISSSPSRPGSPGALRPARGPRHQRALPDADQRRGGHPRALTATAIPIAGDHGGNDLLLVAGGLGMAPLRSLLWYALDNRDKFNNITLMYGAKRPADMLFREELACAGRPHRHQLPAHRGRATRPEPGRTTSACCPSLFDHAKIDPARTYAAVCGPPVVYKFVLQRLLELGFPKNRILMSLERRMKCGVGKCGHCSVGYKYTCMHGPIFTYWDAINLPEMI